jgi:hypothetical protein
MNYFIFLKKQKAFLFLKYLKNKHKDVLSLQTSFLEKIFHNKEYQIKNQ